MLYYADLIKNKIDCIQETFYKCNIDEEITKIHSIIDPSSFILKTRIFTDKNTYLVNQNVIDHILHHYTIINYNELEKMIIEGRESK